MYRNKEDMINADFTWRDERDSSEASYAQVEQIEHLAALREEELTGECIR